MVNPKVKEAFRAMKNLGISEETVKPVLKRLLMVYEKNWALIEAESYRVLADAIFEIDDAKVEEQKKVERNVTTAEVNEEAAANEETLRPKKRLRKRYQDPQTSSPDSHIPGSSLIKPKEEPNVYPQRSIRTRSRSLVVAEMPRIQPDNSGVASGPLAKGKEMEHLPLQSLSVHEVLDISDQDMPGASQRHLRSDNGSSYSHPIHPSNKGKQILNPQNMFRETTPGPSKTAMAIHIEDPKDDCFLMEPKDEPIAEDFIPLEAPSPIRSLGQASTDHVKENGYGLEQHSSAPANNGVLALCNGARITVVPVKDKGETSLKVEIASTPCRKVRIDMSYDLADQRPDFSAPSLQELLDVVENRYLRTNEVQDPKYSLTEVMKGMCDCFLKLGNKSGITGKSLAQDALLDTQFDPEDPLPVIPLLSPCNRPDDYDNSCRSLVVKQSEGSTANMDVVIDVFDITKGQERVVISLTNKVNNESSPSFQYMTANYVFQDANISASLAGIVGKNCCPSCFEDCLSLSKPCACSLWDAFVYTKEGLLKEEFLKECVAMSWAPEKYSHFCEECPLERAKFKGMVEPCKGHLTRKFIKECWVKCGCSKKCGNRVVQQGISRNLQVFMTVDGKGWGLRTLEDIPKGAFVCEYVGGVFTTAEIFHRVEQRKSRGEMQSYPLLLDSDWGCGVGLKDEKALCLDATEYGNVARFINHRCFDSNLVEIPVEIETPDRHYYHVAFFTSRNVKAMEELTWDYGIDFDDIDHPIKAFTCHCGSKYCRSIKHRRRSRSLVICNGASI